jgi:hypothetical protein
MTLQEAVGVDVTLIRSGEKPMRATAKFRAAVITIALTVLVPLHAACAQDVVVFAAASLTNALDEAAQLFERQGGACENLLRRQGA